MKLGRWACSEGPRRSSGLGWARALVVVLLFLVSGRPALAGAQDTRVVAPTHAQVIVVDSEEPPAAADPRWQDHPLAQDEPGRSAWYRLRFDAPLRAAGGGDDPAMLYLPYFYGGGHILLNGVPVAEVQSTSSAQRVRWERPLLLNLPAGALRAQGNELLIHARAEHGHLSTALPRLEVGAQSDLQPLYERRFFFVRTVPILTWVSGTVVGLLVLFIWLQRREEVLYGLFGLAALLWAQRTSTFVLEVLPAGAWEAWRNVYHLCTGGFVVVMALFVLNLAGWSRRWLTRGLVAYGLLGPLLFLALGEGVASRLWTSGLALVGLGMVAVSAAAAWRQRSAETVAICGAVALGVAAGIHDQLVATRSPMLLDWLPNWGDHRLFLLHHAANALLLVMGMLLALRFVRSLNEVEAANRTLEARVQQREREIAASYERIAVLQREQAATDERQRIMRDLHDGLGSQLFTSLSKAERGAMDSAGMADTLRGAIDQMRVAIEALASEEQDFETAFGNFRFRWDSRLREAGLMTHWHIQIPDSSADGVTALAPHDALQLLHIIQEALTNVLKHARATEVTVRVALQDGQLCADIIDNGSAKAAEASRTGGRGRANMHNRAQRLGGQLEWHAQSPGTRVSLRAPWRLPSVPASVTVPALEPGSGGAAAATGAA